MPLTGDKTELRRDLTELTDWDFVRKHDASKNDVLRHVFNDEHAWRRYNITRKRMIDEGRVMHRWSKHWEDHAKEQGLEVKKVRDDQDYTHHAIDKDGKIRGKWVNTKVAQNSHGYIHQLNEATKPVDPKVNRKWTVGDMVYPKVGPHKGEAHKVIHVHPDGSMNIVPQVNVHAQNKYRLGAARCTDDQIDMPVTDKQKAGLDKRNTPKKEKEEPKQHVAVKDAEGKFAGRFKSQEDAEAKHKGGGVTFHPIKLKEDADYPNIEDLMPITELSNPTLRRYISKASDSREKEKLLSRQAYWENERDAKRAHGRKLRNRDRGISKAIDKAPRTPIHEVSKDLLRQYFAAAANSRGAAEKAGDEKTVAQRTAGTGKAFDRLHKDAVKTPSPYKRKWTQVEEGLKEKLKGAIRREKAKDMPLLQNRRDYAHDKAADAYASGDQKKGRRYMEWRDKSLKRDGLPASIVKEMTTSNLLRQTAAASKPKEEPKAQINELSKEKLGKYFDRASNDRTRQTGQVRKYFNRLDGTSLALKKMHPDTELGAPKVSGTGKNRLHETAPLSWDEKERRRQIRKNNAADRKKDKLAWGTGKKVKEEEINEISTELARRYMRAGINQIRSNRGNVHVAKKMRKRDKNIDLAARKVTNQDVKVKTTNIEEGQIDELSANLLHRYTTRASGEFTMAKAGERGSMTDPAKKYWERKARTRKQGVATAIDKVDSHLGRNEKPVKVKARLNEENDSMISEAKRGRPRKNPIAGAEENEREHIIVQLRKNVTMNGTKKIRFADNSEHQVTPKHAEQALSHYAGLSPAHKEGFQKHIEQSHDNLMAFHQWKPEQGSSERPAHRPLDGLGARTVKKPVNRRPKFLSPTEKRLELIRSIAKRKGMTKA
jgi:hypothetical protein